MLDWRREVFKKLKNAGLSSVNREEVARELAGYLDDLCADARSSGLDESAAIKFAVDELYEDARLGTKLYRARREGTMNDRTKGFWLPGLLSLVGSVVFFAIFEIAGLHPYLAGHFDSSVNHFPVTISLPWLCVLPFLGAASAYFSRQAGSGPALRATTGLFPVLVPLATFLIFVPLNFAINGAAGTKAVLPAIAAGMLSSVVIPGAALLLGVLPFLRNGNTTQRIG